MSAAYYDMVIDEGATARYNIKFLDKNKKSLNLLNPDIAFLEGFEERFSSTDPISVYVRMQVRDSVDGGIVPVPLTTNDTGMQGANNVQGSNIQIVLGNGGMVSNVPGTDPNIKITIDSLATAAVNYGNYLYDIEIVFSQDIESHPNAIVFRILQGRFIVTPNITR